MIRRENNVFAPASKTSVSVFLAERLELLDRKIPLRVQLPRPTPCQLQGHLLRILPSPTFQVCGKVLLAPLGLVTLAFVLLTIKTSALVRFLALFAGVEVSAIMGCR